MLPKPQIENIIQTIAKLYICNICRSDRTDFKGYLGIYEIAQKLKGHENFMGTEQTLCE